MSRSLLLAVITSLIGASLFSGCKPGARDMCERYAVAYCKFQYQCCNARERAQLIGFGGVTEHSSEEECVEERQRVLCSLLAQYEDAERGGRLEWDYEGSNECLGAVETAANECSAEDFLSFQFGADGCALGELTSGLVENDDTCFLSDECADDEALCTPEETDPDEIVVTAKGTCTPPPGVGDECPDGFCRDGSFCDVAVDPNVCVPLLDEGEDCDADLQCLTSNCEGAVCSAKRDNDAQCTSPGQCASGFCDYYDTFTCQPLQGDGEPCADDDECAGGECNLNDNTCGAPDNIEYDICLAEEQ
jgi:hypothetical protein